jgi:hypothetical protein
MPNWPAFTLRSPFNLVLLGANLVVIVAIYN